MYKSLGGLKEKYQNHMLEISMENNVRNLYNDIILFNISRT